MDRSSYEGLAANTKVVNDIAIYGREQVMIKVTVAEIDRLVLKQLGINLSGSLSKGPAVVTFNTPGAVNPFPVNGALSTANACFVGTVPSVTAQLQAIDRAGLVRTLAEPTLTAISGESANFLAGGRFPYPTPPQQAGGAPGFQFENFGVSLTFTPWCWRKVASA
jgi:pilus assembly protein CpaC